MQFLILYFLILNLLAYAIMSIDKLKSIYQWWRVSERTLFLLAIL